MSSINDQPQNTRAIFAKAVEEVPPEKWPEFLDGACGDDAALRRHVQRLLDAHAESGSFMKQPAAVAATVGYSDVSEQPGTVIGPYKLREKIGEGGFGVVYVAEQTEPVRRKVALKIIKPGMDTKDVIARFEAERQALAMMDHPNVARVLDAGATKSGRPYFVMELVKGIPITEFCDEQKLSTRERLGLFIAVCQAVGHAHQKGIIHRDLKPSNVMVTLHDGKPVPKVIDFGVAKALSRQLTEKTVYTAYGQMIGTPLYMAPEQTQLSGLDVDTRSDVYSLGVLLYELLTGTTPFDKETLRNADLDEIRRIIREDDPPRPSARVSTLQAEALSTVCDDRRIEPRKLKQSLRGELDWIVVKALEKDRNRRYESAGALAADVGRYLDNKPVRAHPPSALYRFAKFVRRNKRKCSLAGLVVMAVVVACGGLVLLGRLKHEQRRSRTAISNVQESRELFDDVVHREYLAASALIDLARAYGEAEQSEAAEDILGLAVRISHNLAANSPRLTEAGTRMNVLHGLEFAYLQLARVQRRAGNLDSAERNYREAISRAETLVAGYPHRRDFALELSDARLGLARCLIAKSRGRMTERLAEAETNLQEAVALLQQLLVERSKNDKYGIRMSLSNAYGVLTQLHEETGRYQEAAQTARKNSALLEQLAVERPKKYAVRYRLQTAYSDLARSYETIGRYLPAGRTALKSYDAKKAVIADFQTSEEYRRWRGESLTAHRLANRLIQDPDDRRNFDPALAVRLARVPLNHRKPRAEYWATLGMALYRTGEYSEALEALGQAASMRLARTGRCRVELFLAMTHWQLGHREEARRYYDQRMARLKESVADPTSLHALRAEAQRLLETQAANKASRD